MGKIVVLIVTLLAFGLIIGCGGDNEETADQGAAETVLVKDAVCGKSVDPATSTIMADYKENTYHFCSEGCKEKFEANPAEFVMASSADPDHEQEAGAEHQH